MHRRTGGSSRAAALGVLLAGLVASTAHADTTEPGLAAPGDQRPVARPANAGSLGLFAGAGYLGGPGAYGEAFATGVRLGVGAHLAAGVDLGYGLLNASPVAEDRWWVIPSIALVVPAGRL